MFIAASLCAENINDKRFCLDPGDIIYIKSEID